MFFKKNLSQDMPALLIVSVAVAGACIAFAASVFLKPYVESSRSFMVQNRRHVSQNAYDYEGYYTLQTANEATKSLIGWLVSPGGVSAVYREAGVVMRFASLRSYERTFDIRRDNTPFFEVRFRARTQEEAKAMNASLEKLLRTQLLAFQGADSLSLDVSPAVMSYQPVPLFRNVFYGVLAGAIIGAFAYLLKRAIEEGS